MIQFTKLKLLIILFLCTIANVHLKSQNKDSLLIIAAQTNDIGQIKELIKKGANVNAYDKNGANILMWAAYRSNLDAVKYLISKKADILVKGAIYTDTTGSYYGNLVSIAAGENKLDILKYLIEGCKINVDDKEIDPELKQKRAGPLCSGLPAKETALLLNIYWSKGPILMQITP